MNLSFLMPELGAADGKKGEKILHSTPEMPGVSFDSVVEDLARQVHSHEVLAQKVAGEAGVKFEEETPETDSFSAIAGVNSAQDGTPSDFAMLERASAQMSKISTSIAEADDDATLADTPKGASSLIQGADVSDVIKQPQSETDQPQRLKTSSEAFHDSIVITEGAESSPHSLSPTRPLAEAATEPEGTPRVLPKSTPVEAFHVLAQATPAKKAVEPVTAEQRAWVLAHTDTQARTEHPGSGGGAMTSTTSLGTSEIPAVVPKSVQTPFQASLGQAETRTSEGAQPILEQGPVSRLALSAPSVASSANLEVSPTSPSEQQPASARFTPISDNPILTSPQGQIEQTQIAPIRGVAALTQPAQTLSGLSAGTEVSGVAPSEDIGETTEFPAREWTGGKPLQAEKTSLPPTSSEMAIEVVGASKLVLAEPTAFEREFDAIAVAQGSDALTTQTSALGRATDTQSANVARQVIQQLADNGLMANGKVEISLSPEELGRVRLTASQTDQGVILIVQAERPETLDLMRRHLPDLMQDLQDMGFGDVSYSGQRQQQNQEKAAGAIGAGADPIEEAETQIVQAAGLDLRL